MFWCYYVAWPCDLDPLTFWPWECFVYSASRVWPTYQLLFSYDYRLLSYEYWISDHISVIWNSHCACAVSRDLSPGAKNDPHFWNPWTQLTYSLCHFYGATTNFKPCYRRKIAFSYCKGYKVNCACAVSRDLCTGVPPKPHVTIFWPRIVYSLYNLYGATIRIKNSFILEHPHVQAVFGRKSPVKIGPQNGGFSEI